MSKKILQKEGVFYCYDGDTGKAFASPNASFGPWESIGAFEEWFGVPDDDVPDGLVIAVKDPDNNMLHYKRWVLADETNGYWRDVDSNKSVIYIAGVLEDYTKKPSTSIAEGTCDNIYYIKDENGGGVLGLVSNPSSTSGSASYYPLWKNYPEFGVMLETGDVIPYEGSIYITKEGELFIGTSEELDDATGGSAEFDGNQQEALDSGITAALVDELKRLKNLDIQIDAENNKLTIGGNDYNLNSEDSLTDEEIAEVRRLHSMNIQYDGSNDTLTLTDSEAEVTTEYDLSNGGSGVTVTYGTPSITLAYGTISGSGGQISPSTFTVTQEVLYNNVVDHTDTYTSVTALRAALAAGDSLTFGYAEDEEEIFKSISKNGTITAEANPSVSSRSADIVMSLKLHGKTATETVTVSQDGSSAQYYAPVISLGYDNVGAEGGTLSPSVYVTQARSGGLSTLEFNSVVELTAAGATVAFALVDKSSDMAAVIDSNTGVVTVSANTADIEVETNVQVTITGLNGQNKSFTTEDYAITQGAAPTSNLYITSARYVTVKNNSTGVYTATLNVTANDGIERTFEAYSALSHITCTISTECVLTGVTVDSTTGTITYSDTLLTNLAAGNMLYAPTVTLAQTSRDSIALSPEFGFMTGVAVTSLPVFAGVRGSVSGQRLKYNQSPGAATVTLTNGAADDVYLFKVNGTGIENVYIWETSATIIGLSGSTPERKNTSYWEGGANDTVITGTSTGKTFKKFVLDSNGCECVKYISGARWFIYKVVGDAKFTDDTTRITLSLHEGTSSSTVSYAKLT